MKHYTRDTRKSVEADISAEIAKLSGDRKAILRSIFESMHDADVSDTGRLQTTVARFASLLCSLSIQADTIQAWMLRLTIAITVMTAVLIALTVVMLLKM